MTLALLLTAATGAWADSFSTEAYTADATLSAVSVTGNTTLTIKEGVTVTVNNGLTIGSGATLTVTGGGSLAVNGAKGANGWDGNYPGESGSPAIGGSGQLAIANATITATGGAGGNGGFDEYSSQFGGEGGPAVSGVSISIQTGSLTAIGGAGGIGGESTVYHNKYPDGPAGNAFISFPNISDATLSYSTDNVTYTKYESGNTTLYRYMKVEPLDGPKVTTDAAEEGATFTEASFLMPTNDVTVNYELVRDMSVKMSAEVGDGSDGYRIRIKKDGDDFVPVKAEDMLISVSDDLDDQHPIDLTVNTDFTLLVQKKGEGDTWTDLSNEDKLSVGTFRYKVTGAGNYDGTIYSNEFVLFQGYEVVVPAGEYVTYYMEDEPLYADPETSTDAELYTITSVSGDKAILSNAIETAPSGTPLLVYNKGTEEKTFLLIPANAEPNLALDVYDGFIGTMQPTVIPASNATTDNYAFNGKQFVWVMNEIAIGANKAYLSIPKTNGNPKNIRLYRGNGETTGIDASLVNSEEVNSVWYDLNGRKLQGKPSLKGVYIKNGKKVVVH